MTQKKRKVCIVHYNTPELLRACLLSFMKQGTEWHFVIFDNSNQRPVTMEMLSEWELTQTDSTFGIIDNTQGQIIDFNKELAKWPSKRTNSGFVSWLRHHARSCCHVRSAVRQVTM